MRHFISHSLPGYFSSFSLWHGTIRDSQNKCCFKSTNTNQYLVKKSYIPDAVLGPSVAVINHECYKVHLNMESINFAKVLFLDDCYLNAC